MKSTTRKGRPMSVTLPAFTPLEDSLFLTLYARALDNRGPHPILATLRADQIVRTVDYDFGQLRVKTNLILSVALRAKKLDQIASDFLPATPTRSGSTWAPASTLDSSAGPSSHRRLVRRRLPAVATARQRLDPRAPQRPRHRRQRHREGLAGRRPPPADRL